MKLHQKYLVAVALALSLGLFAGHAMAERWRLQRLRAEPCFAEHWHREAAHPVRFSVSLADCLPFSDRMVLEGVWIYGHERSDFYPGARSPKVLHSRPVTPRTELDIDPLAADVILQSAGLNPTAPGDQALFLRFSGRRSLRAPPFSDYSPGDTVVVMDRLISATPVAAPGV